MKTGMRLPDFLAEGPRTMRRLIALVFAFGLMALASCSPTNTCSENFYSTARSKLNDSSSYEKKSCGSHRQARGTSTSYVVHQGIVYSKQSESSTYGTCSGGLGSYSSAGRGGCLVGSTSYDIATHHLFPLDPPVDPKSFQSISDDYGIDDKGHVYYRQLAIQGLQALAPTVNVRPLMQALAEGDISRASSYATYGHHVLFEGRLVENADADSFKTLYLSNGRNTQSDRGAYAFYDFARDKSRMYWHGHVLDDSDPESFQVVSREIVKDKQHTWYIEYERSGEILSRAPAPLGRDYFRSTYTSSAGQPYDRVQWREAKEDGSLVYYPLPMPASALAADFTVLPTSCRSKGQQLETQPKFGCIPSSYERFSEFARGPGKVFFRNMEVEGADAASFQPFNVVRYEEGGIKKSYAMDVNRLYIFEGYGDSPGTMDLSGPAIGPIPDPYGWLQLMADSRDIYDYGIGQSAKLCRYGGPASTSDLKVVERKEGEGGQPFIVLANSKYRYVFYQRPDHSRSHVVDLVTGQTLRIQEACGPIAAK